MSLLLTYFVDEDVEVRAKTMVAAIKKSTINVPHRINFEVFRRIQFLFGLNRQYNNIHCFSRDIDSLTVLIRYNHLL